MQIVRFYQLVMPCIKMFCKVIGKIFLPWMLCYIKILNFNLVGDPKEIFSMARDCCFFTVLFAMATAVVLSQCTGVGGCLCSSSSSVSRSVVPS